MSVATQPSLSTSMVACDPMDVDDVNLLLERWGHDLGRCNRPFRQEGFGLFVDGEPVSVAMSASLISDHLSDADGAVVATRDETVELARLCTHPDERWATRVMLRLWRETCGPRWACWPVRVAASYSLNANHDGRIYRFDGWTKVRDDCGSSGGGAWSRMRYASAAHHGPKTLWTWTYGATP